MASAKKCDRCGKLYEGYNEECDRDKINGVITVNIDSNQNYFKNKIIDFCPDCKDSFQEWLSFGIMDEILKEN